MEGAEWTARNASWGRSPFHSDGGNDFARTRPATFGAPEFTTDEARAIIAMESPPESLVPMQQRARDFLRDQERAQQEQDADVAGPVVEPRPMVPTTATLLHAEGKAKRIRAQRDKWDSYISEKQAELDTLQQEQRAINDRLAVAEARVSDIRGALGFTGDQGPIQRSLPVLLSPSAVDHIAAAFNKYLAGSLSQGAFRMLLADAERAAVAGVPADGSESGLGSQDEHMQYRDDFSAPEGPGWEASCTIYCFSSHIANISILHMSCRIPLLLLSVSLTPSLAPPLLNVLLLSQLKFRMSQIHRIHWKPLGSPAMV